MLTIEFAEPSSTKCECCGGLTTSLTRFVYDEGVACAMYYASYGPDHDPRVVDAVVSLGDWTENSAPWNRIAFPLRLRAPEGEYEVMVVDAAESPWEGIELLGRMLDRAEALQDERLEEVLHITDHIVREDAPLREYLNGAA